MKTITPTGHVNQVFLRCVEDCFEPIMLTDCSGHLTYVNPAWVLTYGYEREEAIGQTPRLLRSINQSPEFYKTMWKEILDPKIGFWRGEISNQAKDGHIVQVLLTITPHRSPTGEILGYMGIAVDLSEQKRMEQQILRQDRLASIGMLASGLAHEIGNPLGVIRGRAELVLKQIENQEGARRDVEVIIDQIDRISGLMNSLLRVSREPTKIILQKVNLQLVIEDVLMLIKEACTADKIELRALNLDLFVMAEANHLQQLFLNLFINAMHSIEEKRKGERETGPPAHFIEISAERKSEEICIKIRDSGTGITAENLPKIFQPFFTTKPTGKGTGLGLAIVTKLVEEMGGKISALSEGIGHGATFVLDLKSS